MSSKIEKIRAACSIEWAWLNLGFPGRPARTCKSPFREDKKPSFSVYMSSSGQRWYDQATAEGGDVIDFWAKAKEISNEEAFGQLCVMLGIEVKASAKYKPEPESKVEWPHDLRPASEVECEALGMLRDLPAAAFDIANRLGFLKVGMHKGEVLWFLTDASGKGGEGKTFTGEPCAASGKKTAALPGTSKSWCYGLKSENEYWDKIDKLILVEGVPDFFAALELVTNYPGNARPITMLGASTRPGDETRSYINDRECLIIGHNDPEGVKAIEMWRKRLQELGAAKVIVQGLPEGYKDLCEFVSSNDSEQTLHVLKGLST